MCSLALSNELLRATEALASLPNVSVMEGCPKAPKQLNAPRARIIGGLSDEQITLVTPHEEPQPIVERAARVNKNPLQSDGSLLAKLPAHNCQMSPLCK